RSTPTACTRITSPTHCSNHCTTRCPGKTWRSNRLLNRPHSPTTIRPLRRSPMLVLPRMIGVGMLSMLVGCVGLQEQQGGFDDAHSTDHAHNKAGGNSIEISVSSRCGVGGGRYSETKWVLSPTGDIQGTATDVPGRGPLAKVKMQLHSKEAYQ